MPDEIHYGPEVHAAIAEASGFWRSEITVFQISATRRLIDKGHRDSAVLARQLEALKTIAYIENLLVMQSVNDRLGIRSPFFNNAELMRWGEVTYDDLREASDRLWYTASRPASPRRRRNNDYPRDREYDPRDNYPRERNNYPRNDYPRERNDNPRERNDDPREREYSSQSKRSEAPASKLQAPAEGSKPKNPVPPPKPGTYPTFNAPEPKGEAREMQDMLQAFHAKWRNEHLQWMADGAQGKPPQPHPILKEAIRMWAQHDEGARKEYELICRLETLPGGPTQATRV